MSVKQVQIKAQDLALGMYISALDRAWAQTPFPLQGFYIRSPKDIETLKSYCEYVYIDVTKGRSPIKPSDVKSTISKATTDKPLKSSPHILAHRVGTKVANSASRQTPKPSLIKIQEGVYETTEPMRVEAVQAEKIIRELKGNLTLAIKLIAKGRPVDYKTLKGSVEAMVSSVLRCPDAFIWLLRLRNKDQHSHDHTLRAGLLAVQFARYAGMDKDDIAILSMGVLLKDVGKINLPNALLRKETRNPEEEEEYRKFVTYGVNALRKTKSIEPKVVSVVRYHCERMDGQGFPEGIAGHKIPLLARIAAIATVYDRISNPREVQEPVAPSKAVSMLYNMRDNAFQEDLVVKFIQSIGLYPTGTVVELTSGDIGVILEQHPKSRLLPTIAVLDGLSGSLNSDCLIIDLKDEAKSRQKLLASGRENINNISKLAIARDLEPTGYDIDYDNVSSIFMGHKEEKQKQGIFTTLRQKLFG